MRRVGGYTYHLNPRYRFYPHRYGDKTDLAKKRNLFSCFVSFGIPQMPDGRADLARFASFRNDKMRLGIRTDMHGGTDWPLLYAFHVHGVEHPHWIEGPWWQSDACESYVRFYHDVIVAAAKRLDAPRFAVFIEEIARSVIEERGLSTNGLAEQTRKCVDRHALIEASPFLAGDEQTVLDRAVRLLRDILKQFSVEDTESEDLNIIVQEAISAGLVPSALIVLSEYAFPSFAVGPNGCWFENIVEKLNEIAAKYNVYIHGGTLNNCYIDTDQSNESRNYGYAYGVFIKPPHLSEPTHPMRIFKREHAMSGDREKVYEGFIGHPFVAGLDVFFTDAGYLSFPICADFISTQFDSVLGVCFSELKPINYVISPGRDFSITGYLNNKLEAPLSEWHFSKDCDVRKIGVFLKRCPLYFGFVNALEAGAELQRKRQEKIGGQEIFGLPTSQKDDRRKDHGANLQGLFRVSGVDKPVNSNPVRAIDTVFLARPYGDSGHDKTILCEKIKRREDAINMWLSKDFATRNFAAFLSFYRTASFSKLEMRPSADPAEY